MTNTHVSFRLTEEMRDQLRRIKERDGIPLSEQFRRAIQQWIAQREAVTEPSQKRRRRG